MLLYTGMLLLSCATLQSGMGPSSLLTEPRSGIKSVREAHSCLLIRFAGLQRMSTCGAGAAVVPRKRIVPVAQCTNRSAPAWSPFFCS